MPSPIDNTVQMLIIIILVLAVVCAALLVTVVVISILLVHTFRKKLKKSRITVDSGMYMPDGIHPCIPTCTLPSSEKLHACMHADMVIK